MNCLNCTQPLQQPNAFCSQCGAKVITDRITTKSIWKDFATDFIGWDNKYFVTVWKMITSPAEVIQPYLAGVRKRYVQPFAFLAVGTTLAVLIFNLYSDQYAKASVSLNEKQFELMQGQFNKTDDVAVLAQEKEIYLKDMEKMQMKMLKYLNLVTFLILPLYAFLSLMIFGKPQNYAEHLAINCYVQGVSFLFTVLFFSLSLLIHPYFYYFSFAVTVSLYLYVYQRLHQYPFSKVIIKLLKFIGLIILTGIILFLLGFLSAYAYKILIE